MPKSNWILEFSRDPACLLQQVQQGVIHASAEVLFTSSDPQVIAGEVAEQFARHGYRGEEILLALSADQCLSASFERSSSAPQASRETLAFELEHWLPLAAEEIVVDFVHSATTVFAVAAEVDGLLPLVEALEEVGVTVGSIVPSAVLALMQHLPQATTERHLVLWWDDKSVQLWLIEQRQPVQWWHLPAEPERLALHLRALLLDTPDIVSMVYYNVPHDSQGMLAAHWPALPVERRAATPREAAAQSATATLSGNSTPLIELRRDRLGASDPWRSFRGALRSVGVAAILAALGLSVALLVRTQRMESQIGALRSQQEQKFREAIPGQPPPVGILTRLRSERDKLAGQLGQDTGLPETTSAMLLLHEVLAALPEQTRFRLYEIQLDQGQIAIDGEVRRHSDADLLARAFRVQGFEVASPRTQRLSDGTVSVRFTARLSPPQPVVSPPNPT